MANKSLFSSFNRRIPPADTVNEAGGRAYARSPKEALAQLAATGCFNRTFYATGARQLVDLKRLIDDVSDVDFLAKLAVYSRQRAMMKDMPAALLVSVWVRDPQKAHGIFDRVVDNGRMLRNVFQMVRSGQFGRRSLSSSMQRAFQRWFNETPVRGLLAASIGNEPRLRDVMRMARPKPVSNERRALFGYLTDRPVENWAPAAAVDLPSQVVALQKYRAATSADAQVNILRDLSVRWDLLADAARGPAVWRAIARQMGLQALRMNLNTLLRQGVFGEQNSNRGMIDFVAKRLSDRKAVQRSRQFPYQFLAAYKHANPELPAKIRRALHDAAEVACGNIPELPGPIVIGVDVSGSMQSPVTGHRGRGATSAMRCVDVAALFAAAVLRRNPDSVVIPFDTVAYYVRIDPSDSVLSLADRLARYGGGGTQCSLPLAHANKKYRNRAFAGVVLVSDNESWIGQGRYGSTDVMTQWTAFVKNQSRLHAATSESPKLICIDIAPYGTTQAPTRSDILNIGGFSDAVFKVTSAFLASSESTFVAEVESVTI